jgi:hypothetical protein
VRAGARVVEVPVEVDHAHTGRTLAGFSHRAAQGWDLIRALWPRLLAEPARQLLLVGAATLAVALLAATAMAAVPDGAALGPADAVVLVAAPPTLRLDDLEAPGRPELTSLAGERGAVAAANVVVPGHTSWSSWATVGAGSKLRAGPPSREPDAERPFRVQDIVEGQGRLGDALHRAGRTTAFVGTDPTSAVRLAVADGLGQTDRAATAGSLGSAGLVNRSRSDLDAGAALVAVDATGLDPGGLEDLLSGLRPENGERRLLLVVTPADRGGTFGLRPLEASGPGAPAGRLVSRSTRQDGLVLLSDVAPTVLAALSVPVPDLMDGRPLRRLPAAGDVAGLVEADRTARQRNTVWDPALLAVIPLHFLSYGWAWAWRRRTGRGLGLRALHHLGLGLVAWPLATWLTRAVPGSGGLGRWAGLVALAIDAVAVAVAWRLGRRRGLAPLAWVLGATVALVTLDLGLGGGLQISSAFGNAAHTAGRFTGLGNTAFAVYAACALLAVHCGRRRAPWMVALLVLVALVDALPSLGDDVGGALTLAPIFALAVAALWGRLSVRALVLAAAATAAVVAVALALDLSQPAGRRTHLARFVTGQGHGASIGGKLTQNLDTYAALPPLALVVAIALGFAVLLGRGRFRRALPSGSPARIAVAAGLAVALLGNLLNDSGPIVTLLAMSILAPSLVVRAAAATEPPPAILPPTPVAAAT